MMEENTRQYDVARIVVKSRRCDVGMETRARAPGATEKKYDANE